MLSAKKIPPALGDERKINDMYPCALHAQKTDPKTSVAIKSSP